MLLVQDFDGAHRAVMNRACWRSSAIETATWIHLRVLLFDALLVPVYVVNQLVGLGDGCRFLGLRPDLLLLQVLLMDQLKQVFHLLTSVELLFLPSVRLMLFFLSRVLIDDAHVALHAVR